MEIETERLLLRPWKKNKSDARELYRYAKHPKVGPSAGWPVHISQEDSMRVIRTVLSTRDIYAMVLKETGNPIGAAGITYRETGRKYLKRTEGEIGYWVGVPYWGQGYAGEAVRAILRRAFEDLHFTAVWAAYYEGNEQSRRVQEKCGFTFHHTEYGQVVEALGETRTEHFMRLTREEWEALQAQKGLEKPLS